jgi:hypothetical protein
MIFMTFAKQIFPCSFLRRPKFPATTKENGPSAIEKESAGAANLEAGFPPGGANRPEAWNRRLVSRIRSKQILPRNGCLIRL